MRWRGRRLMTVVGLVATWAAAPLQADVHLEDGTRVRTALLGFVSSETSRPGDSVTLEVVRDVIVNGVVVITRGTLVNGAIQEAVPARFGGRSGHLAMAITVTRSVDGQRISLRPSMAEQDHRVIPVGRVRRHLLVWAAEGRMFDVVVDGEYSVAPPPAPPPAPPITHVERPGRTVMVNEDVLKLVAAGIGEDVIVAAIRASRTRFQLGADDLAGLKNTGISDRVMIAMIEASRQPIRLFK